MKAAILIPAYNAEATIAETLSSIQSQPPHALERIAKLLLVDDCSADKTSQIAVKQWAGTHPSLEIHRNKFNRGERASCNSAFSRLVADGYTWCIVLHADDIAKPNWLSTIFSQIDGSTLNTASICSSWDDLYEDGRVVAGEDCPDQYPKVIRGGIESAAGTLKNGCWWHFSGCAMHLASFHEVGPFDEGMPQLGDLDWLIRALLSKKQVTYIPQALIFYRSTNGNVSSISFSTNRDLKEKLAILKKLSIIPELQHQIMISTNRQVILCFRRFLGRAARRRHASALSALQLLLDSLVFMARHMAMMNKIRLPFA